MSRKDLYDYLNALEGDIEFLYHGIHGAICPFSLTDISLSFGNKEQTYDSIEDAMGDAFFEGKSLNDISEELEIL